MMKKGVKRGRPSSASARTMKHRERYKEKYDKYRNDKRVETKAELVDGYGGKCTCCGESTLEFLTLEHLEKDGKKHRADRHNSQGTYKDVISMGFPDNYTVLCLNCNHARRYGKECPHKEKGDMGKRSVTIDRLVEALSRVCSAEDSARDAPGILYDAVSEAEALLAELSAHNGENQ